ncbi:MAG: ABC transporter ATP-binding protein [Actinomycetota bacterium]|nr:ABC transporter ATP-binding protein [Actinomycetota bacterium]
MQLLEIKDLEVFYGKIQALRGISVSVNSGEIVSLIGANGAGKTTTLKTISGLRKVHSGSITFKGEDITNMVGHKRVHLGLCQAPEGRGVFPGMTVVENLEMGAYSRKKSESGKVKEDFDRVFDLFPRLNERRKQIAGTMSGGEQQMLAIGRALMSSPELLLLDEPSMGLAPMLVSQIFDIIQEINRQGTTILVVEQNATKALSISNRAYVLETGSVTRSADAKELLDDDSIRKAYLGE